MPFTKGLILVFRSESIDDFKDIAWRVYKIDSSIQVFGFSDRIDPKKIPREFFNLPHLVIYLCNPPPDNFSYHSPMLAVRGIDKIAEYQHFKKHNIPCLPIEQFKWGMTLDPEVYGDWVVLKPQSIQSTGKDVNMIPTILISKLNLSDFPEDHLIRQDGYYVQKFVKTGIRPTHYRVGIFIDSITYSTKTVMNSDYPSDNDNLRTRLSKTIAANFVSNRHVCLYKDLKLNEFAINVAKTFPKIPLFGIDVLIEEETGKLFALETNSGGNTWHFSSSIGKQYRTDLGGRNQLIEQYNSWDKVAECLVRKINELST
jgi:hypothetical protein